MYIFTISGMPLKITFSGYRVTTLIVIISSTVSKTPPDSLQRLTITTQLQFSIDNFERIFLIKIKQSHLTLSDKTHELGWLRGNTLQWFLIIL